MIGACGTSGLRFGRLAPTRSWRAVAGLALLVLPGSAWAQAAPAPTPDGFDVSGSIRLRYEAIDGQVRPGFNASDNLIDLRTIITATYKTGWFRVGGEVYDSRSYLGNHGTPLSTNEVNAIEPVQAWVAADIADPFGPGTSLSLQGGRFQLNLGSRRLVAGDDYRNTTNGFTGIRADLGFRGKVKATFAYVLPQARLPDDLSSLLDNKVRFDRESFDQVLWGGTISRRRTIGVAMAELGFIHFGERDAPGRPTRDRSLNTVSARLVSGPKPGAFDYELEGMYQFGRIATSLSAAAPRLPVSAWFAHGAIGYTLPGGWKPRIAAELDIASGDRAGGSYGRFDSLFGMRRADTGPVGLYNVVARTNVLTPGARAEFAPGKRVDAMLSYRLLWLESATDSFAGTGVRDASGRAGRFAGQQIDARLRYWLVPQRLRFELDGVWLAKGRFLQDAPNAPQTGDTKYLSVNLSASL